MMLPGFTGIVFVLSGALPSIVSGYDIYPHMAVLLTCFWVMQYPYAWPYWFACILGLLQDVLSGSAMGAQALLLMLLVFVVRRQTGRMNRQNFRMLWIEVAVMMALYMGALWLIMSWVSHTWLPLWPGVKEVVLSVLLYPLVHILLQPILRLLPPLR